jgi:hypothetical protein
VPDGPLNNKPKKENKSMSWSVTVEGPLNDVIQQLDRHRLDYLVSPEQDRQYDRVKQMALAELRSYPAHCAAGCDEVVVGMSGHRQEECFGTVSLRIHGKRKELQPVPVGTQPETAPKEGIPLSGTVNGVEATVSGNMVIGNRSESTPPADQDNPGTTSESEVTTPQTDTANNTGPTGESK